MIPKDTLFYLKEQFLDYETLPYNLVKIGGYSVLCRTYDELKDLPRATIIDEVQDEIDLIKEAELPQDFIYNLKEDPSDLNLKKFCALANKAKEKLEGGFMSLEYNKDAELTIEDLTPYITPEKKFSAADIPTYKELKSILKCGQWFSSPIPLPEIFDNPDLKPLRDLVESVQDVEYTWIIDSDYDNQRNKVLALEKEDELVPCSFKLDSLREKITEMKKVLNTKASEEYLEVLQDVLSKKLKVDEFSQKFMEKTPLITEDDEYNERISTTFKGHQELLKKYQNENKTVTLQTTVTLEDKSMRALL